ncbi:SAM-dependent methyltransferase [Nocardia cyriacigeorgica]|nr:SAM-dependent methyltransferase [Nocardia cyriacigeorgica]MBF6159471.1 SAM-dependent methyltransferase [Nocardia cyriacigeorgica]MBF6198554.1 SAM-dependent methyltransferase [Nocardia cyriacigeorgica]MBF6515009.1 SAM-dependent methyltransferase [Nocardia cyriacigeorgica]
MSQPAPTTGVRVPVGVDTTRASIARVYDYSLVGKDNYDVDRAAFDMILQAAPRQRDVSKMNRRWLHRVTRYLAGTVGIDQFLDIGAGLPTVGNTHEIAQSQNAEATVVYVDNDPVCNAHGRVLLETNDRVRFVSADLTQPSRLLSDLDVQRRIDFARPLGLILCGILHHVDDELVPAAIVRRYVDALAPGSYVAITHFWNPNDGSELADLATQVERQFVEMGLGSGWYRTREEIASYFGGLELIAPGLVELEQWWPMGPPIREPFPEERIMLGGVARKPMEPAGRPVRR